MMHLVNDPAPPPKTSNKRMIYLFDGGPGVLVQDGLDGVGAEKVVAVVPSHPQVADKLLQQQQQH